MDLKKRLGPKRVLFEDGFDESWLFGGSGWWECGREERRKEEGCDGIRQEEGNDKQVSSTCSTTKDEENAIIYILRMFE